MTTNPKIDAYDSPKDIFFKWIFHDYKLFQLIVLTYNLVVSTILIVSLSKRSDEIVWKSLGYGSFKVELPDSYYLFVVNTIMCLGIIYANRLMLLLFKKMEKNGRNKSN